MSTPSPLSQMEALLFMSGEPLSYAQLGRLLHLSRKAIQDLALQLKKHLASKAESGLMLIEKGDSLELATKKEHASLIEALTKKTLQENLSRAALEVLSIIAYRSPLTRSSIEAIRGVNCSFTLRNLLLRGLIERSENPEDSREYIYAPSFAFLEKLGLGSVQELPDFRTLSQDERLSLALGENSETRENLTP